MIRVGTATGGAPTVIAATLSPACVAGQAEVNRPGSRRVSGPRGILKLWFARHDFTEDTDGPTPEEYQRAGPEHQGPAEADLPSAAAEEGVREVSEWRAEREASCPEAAAAFVGPPPAVS